MNGDELGSKYFVSCGKIAQTVCPKCSRCSSSRHWNIEAVDPFCSGLTLRCFSYQSISFFGSFALKNIPPNLRPAHQDLHHTIDREDISKLASLYDDVLDYIYAAVNRLYLYEISSPTEPMRRFTELVVKSVREIDFAFASIHKIKAPEVESRIIEVDRLENEADVVLNEAVAALFKTTDAISIIKLKEIYELMETITDKCEDVVQVIRDIILEYS